MAVILAQSDIEHFLNGPDTASAGADHLTDRPDSVVASQFNNVVEAKEAPVPRNDYQNQPDFIHHISLN